MATARIRTSELRSIHHMTQAALAEKAQLSKTTISNLESGHQTKIALDTIAKLCRALDCSPAELFELKDNKEEKVLQQQRRALEPFVGSLNYTKPFDPSTLDEDIALMIDAKKRKGKE